MCIARSLARITANSSRALCAVERDTRRAHWPDWRYAHPSMKNIYKLPYFLNHHEKGGERDGET